MDLKGSIPSLFQVYISVLAIDRSGFQACIPRKWWGLYCSKSNSSGSQEYFLECGGGVYFSNSFL